MPTHNSGYQLWTNIVFDGNLLTNTACQGFGTNLSIPVTPIPVQQLCFLNPSECFVRSLGFDRQKLSDVAEKSFRIVQARN